MTISPTSVQNAQGEAQRLGLRDIAFLGKAGAGKSTAADYLVKEHGYRRLSFAEPLKDIAAELWGEEARTDRQKLQALGSAVREIDPDAWVNLLLRRAGCYRGPIVVDDLRFPNEWWALKGAGFVLIRVMAPEYRRIERLRKNGKWQDATQLGHISETALDSKEYLTDHLLHNWQTPEDLHADVFRVLERLVR